MKFEILVAILITLTLSQACNRFGTSTNGVCRYPNYIEGCFTYEADGSCSRCQYNYQISNGVCNFVPKQSQSQCCNSYDANSRCTQCANGLLFNTITALCEDRKIVGCIAKDQYACISCGNGFDLVDGTCVLSTVGCSTYNGQVGCNRCKNGFSLHPLGYCIPVKTYTTISNCQQYNDFGCTVCQIGFRLTQEGTCQVAQIAGCAKYSIDGATCVQCQNPYFKLSANGQCQLVGCLSTNGANCASCNAQAGFVLNQGHCQIPNCLYYLSTGCAVCKNGMIAGSWGCKDRNSDQICQICKQNQYRGPNGLCLPKDIRCINYESNGFCSSCVVGYHVSQDGLCEKNALGCVYEDGVCTSCVRPWTFNNQACIIPGCQIYDETGCKKCNIRLGLTGKICTIANCVTFDSNFVCTHCATNYVPNSRGICATSDPFCSAYNQITGICTTCVNGYRIGVSNLCQKVKHGCSYVDNRCTSCRSPFSYNATEQNCYIDGCQNYFIGGCQLCDTRYTLIFHDCKLPNCLISKNGICKQCDPDYIKLTNGTCINKDEFCITRNQLGICIQCMNNYYMNTQTNKCTLKAPGCIYANNSCVSCNSPFRHEGGRCIINGCLQYNYTGCLLCLYPYAIDKKEQTCFIPHCTKYNAGKCQACQDQWTLNAEKVCEHSDPKCEQFNPERTACNKCVKSYYKDKRGRCQFGQNYCSQFDNFGVCMNCDILYFLNPRGKCQLKDPQCKTYTNGYCTSCSPYFFPNKGYCFPNLKGCKIQKNYQECLRCDDGYDMDNGVCKIHIKKLTWDDVDMDFFESDNAQEYATAKNTFTVGVNSKLHLSPILQNKQATIIYSSISKYPDTQYQTNSAGNGWGVSQALPQWVGIKSKATQTFYAVDLKMLAGSSLNGVQLQYSMDCNTYTSLGDLAVNDALPGITKTIYIKPTEALCMRIVVKSGSPNFKFDFWYSDQIDEIDSESEQPNEDTFIQKSISDVLEGVSGKSTCSSDSLCWAGVQSCQPKNLLGFQLIYDEIQQEDKVTGVSMEYSTDGMTFTCYDSCKIYKLTNNSLKFPTAIFAQKMRVHFKQYTGEPEFGIKFNWGS